MGCNSNVGYKLFTNHLLTYWDIQVPPPPKKKCVSTVSRRISIQGSSSFNAGGPTFVATQAAEVFRLKGSSGGGWFPPLRIQRIKPLQIHPSLKLTNIAPENRPLEKEIYLLETTIFFKGRTVSFRECNMEHNHGGLFERSFSF